MNQRTMMSFLLGITFFCFLSSAKADILLEDLKGKVIPFSSLKGNWVFLNFWASWCGPCVDEISELNRFYERNKTKNIVVFAVNYDSPSLYKQQRLSRKFNIHYPSLKYSSLYPLNLGNITAVPVTFVFNPEGQLTTELYGGQTVTSLNEFMSEMGQSLKSHV